MIKGGGGRHLLIFNQFNVLNLKDIYERNYLWHSRRESPA